ncbi:helix-turn-helix transcriptional regulator [Clostridium estertheticum]|uniref:helix-turn-helix transcriptional regulator n=1 Tax=Clostridium estertheticum TaxID=238834 RepID=UPI001C7CCCBF|nr:WYL domain-containing protein [Clostridium estertheticum]MBX4271846.1 WYL domain-containing protein [Clostridium estertheticum]WLC78282.1 WYL domain-containing protein [Clostridium estertheticum]
MGNKNISSKTEKRNAITYIIYEMLKGKKLTTKEMAELVGKDQRTCERYVNEIKDSDLPIRREVSQYYLNTDDGYLPFYLSKEKINLLYISLISFSAFGRDLKLVNDLLHQIEELVSPRDKELLDSIKENLVVIRRYEIITVKSYSSYEIFMLLLDAFSKKRCVKIKYKSKKEHNYRVIDIYGFCLAKETYYINAFCHKANKELMFRIDRITECYIEDVYYCISENFSLKEYYKYTWEVEKSKEPFDFEILFCGMSVNNIKERKWCENQQIIERDSCSIVFTGTTSSEIEFKKWILSFGGEAKVIKPQWLKESIKEELKRAIALYD